MYSSKALHTHRLVRLFGETIQRTAGVSQSASPPKMLLSSDEPENSEWSRKIFSGIQPTGSLHLGNYLGALQKWTRLQNAREDVTYCVVDMHSITLPQESAVLRQNIFESVATMLACGINPQRSTIFVQSAVREHTTLCWILSCMTTMARLQHLPQYKEKSRRVKEVPLGLFLYPVLQAADIMLYKATHVPIGEDQVQHIQLAQHLARTFNTKYGPTFPICHAIIDNKEAARIRSLRDPTKKMSKSDPDPKATINLMDEPEVIVEKIKKAVTDFISDVDYDPSMRPGVSNLVAIHSLVTGQSIQDIVKEAKTLDTGRYKLRVADAVVEHLQPIRLEVKKHLKERTELIRLLDAGAQKARDMANETMNEVLQKVGLGAKFMPLKNENIPAAIKEALQKTAPIEKPSYKGQSKFMQMPRYREKPSLMEKMTLMEKPSLIMEKMTLVEKPLPKQEIVIEKKSASCPSVVAESATDVKSETEAVEVTETEEVACDNQPVGTKEAKL